jgi:tetratricopeptide (TPR) repeat protein
MGDLRGARVELEALPKNLSHIQPTGRLYLTYDRHYRARIALARTLWLQGHPTEAVERALEAIEGAERMDHPASLAVVLAWAASVFLWCGDLARAEQQINSCVSLAEANSLGPLIAVGRGRRGELAIRRGDAAEGIESLRVALKTIHAVRYELLTTEFNISLVLGLGVVGRFAEATTLLDRTIRQVEANGDALYMPELLRVRGGLLLSMPQPSVDDAETCFMQSLDLSRHQGARAWQLRAALDLATLRADQGQREAARLLLQSMLEQFVEGAETADIRAAHQLLAALS